MYKLLFILLTSSIYSLTSYCQEDLRDYLVGEYTYELYEEYSDDDEPFEITGDYSIKKKGENELIVIERYKGETLQSYTFVIQEKKDNALILSIPEQEKFDSKNVSHKGVKKVKYLDSFYEGVFFLNENKLVFYLFTDQPKMNNSIEGRYTCFKIEQ